MNNNIFNSKNMKRIYVFMFTLIMASLLTNCHEVEEWWKEPTDGIPPGKVTVVNTLRLSGGAKIVIGRPSDTDLLGVKALYTKSTAHANNVTQTDIETFVSAFTDTIALEGFGDTTVYEVTLIAVDKSLNESESVKTTIQPLPNIIESIKESIKVYDNFGGLYVTWENPTREDIALALSVYDSAAGLYDLAAPLEYSKNSKFGKTIKGLEMSVAKQYRLEILDRWKNYSSPFDVIGNPLVENTIPSKDEYGEYIWSRYQSADDGSENWKYRGEVGNYTPLWEGMDNSWENTLGWDCGLDAGNFNPGSNAGRMDMEYPMYYIMDMGRTASYSTYIFHQRKRDPLGSADFPVEFEIWGTLIPPKEPSEIGDGSLVANLQYWTPWVKVSGGSNGTPALIIEGQDTWKTDPDAGWTRLDSCSYVLPSGVRKGLVGEWPVNPLSAEDQDYINAGIVFEMDETVPVRYLRFVIHETSKDDRKITILEQEFRGAYTDY
jgi:hypothetical protein